MPGQGGPNCWALLLRQSLAAEVITTLCSLARALGIPFILAALVVVQTGWSRESTSITVDEKLYLSLAINSVHKGALDPGLARAGSAPLPIVLNYIPALLHNTPTPRAHPWRGEPGDGSLIALPRLFTTLTSLVPLVFLAYFWLEARHGRCAAAIGAGLLAFSPTMLAHASLATQDAAFAFQATLAVITMGWYWKAPSWKRLSVTALATALAVSAKYTGILLIACFLFVSLAQSLIRQLRASECDWSGDIRRGLTYVLLTLTFTWALHGFQCTGNAVAVARETPGHELDSRRPREENMGRNAPGGFSRVGLGEPGFVRGIRKQLHHSRSGHPAFLLGMRSVTGWWWYFPVAMLLKSTLPELALALAGLFAAIWSVRRVKGLQKAIRDPDRIVMLLFLLILALALSGSHINIGHRYAIGLYPIGVLLVTDLLAEWGAAKTRELRVKAAGLLLLGMQACTNLAAAPGYLSYFNRIAGGPERGWRHLADSNIDWGQDLPALKRVLAKEGYDRVAIDYFGTAALEGYGITADRIDALKHPRSDYDAFAVSVTSLQSIYPKGDEDLRHVRDSYAALRAVEPSQRAGASIFIYDLRNPAARRAFLGAAESVAQRVATSKPREIAKQDRPSTRIR
jgi:hypothetical protein